MALSCGSPYRITGGWSGESPKTYRGDLDFLSACSYEWVRTTVVQFIQKGGAESKNTVVENGPDPLPDNSMQITSITKED